MNLNLFFFLLNKIGLLKIFKFKFLLELKFIDDVKVLEVDFLEFVVDIIKFLLFNGLLILVILIKYLDLLNWFFLIVLSFFNCGF